MSENRIETFIEYNFMLGSLLRQKKYFSRRLSYGQKKVAPKGATDSYDLLLT
ncbi:MAG: hypothetical protein KAT90_14420 [Gammaproteobacteria bacterium]|nr:hypothetical protein [Gammaproteobacteria bacterium]